MRTFIRVAVHVAKLFYREIIKVLTSGVSEYCVISTVW